MKELEIILKDFKENQKADYIHWKRDIFKYRMLPTPELEYIIETWKPKIGIYAGSFAPFHLGHYNILQKAEKIFDKVIIAQGVNPDKKEKYFADYFYSDRIIGTNLPKKIEDRQIKYYDGLLTELLDGLGYDVTLIRGLRNATDLQYELTQFQFLQEMKPDINIVNIFCDKQYEHISSSAIRNLMKYGDVYKKYLI